MATRSRAESLAPLSVISSLFPLPPASPLTPLTPAFPSPNGNSPTNPPLTRPPKGPLPVAPAQPRFSDHEAVLRLSSSSSIRSRMSAETGSGSSMYVSDDETDPVLPASDISPSNSAKDLISSVEFPGEAEEEDDLPTTTLSTAPPVDPQVLHRHIRSARSRSHSHKQALQQWGKSSSPSPSPRPVSPDLEAILSSTPRPKRGKSTSNLSASARSKSRTDSRRPGSLKRRVSDGAAIIDPLSRSLSGMPRVSRAFSDRSWVEEDFIDDYGVPSARVSLPYDPVDLDDEAAFRLERQLEGDGGSDSDSSLDLHTPLPHLMVRHGLLSPRSKLLTNSRPESKASFHSTTSVVTKSGIIKDARDTPQRRVRHRDGRQLRGGLGLTTGLGWSDSEDEDAPSALTRRISTLNLSRASSVSSMRSRSSKKAAVSRSFSSTSLVSEDEPSLPRRKSQPANRSSSRQSQSKSLPSRSRASGASATEAYTRTFHLPSRVASPPISSVATHTSFAAVVEPKGWTPTSVQRSPSYESADSLSFDVSHRSSHNEDTSSSSTISVPLPLTPKDDHISLMRTTTTQTPSKLPFSGLKKKGSQASMVQPPAVGLRPRAFSSGSSLTHIKTGPPPSEPLPPPPTTAPLRAPRPLKLPMAQGRSSLSAVGGDRPAVPVPRVSSSSSAGSIRDSGVLPRSSIGSISRVSTSPPNPGIPRPKSRTGTGMVYRSSSFTRRASEGASRIGTPNHSTTAVRQKPIPI